MKVTYFLYNERLDEPILTSQVFKLWTDYANKFNEDDVEVIIFQNIFHYVINFHRILSLKIKFSSIKIKIYPFAIPTRGYFLKGSLMSLHKFLFKFTSRVIKNKNVLSRGYIGSFLLVHESRFNLIADIRSLFVRENIGVRWEKNSIDFKYWMNIEKNIVEFSESVIVVNKSMEDYLNFNYNKFGAKLNLIPIYTSTNYNEFTTTINTSSNTINLFYVGSLGNSKWNDFNAYFDFIKSLSRFPNKKIFKITLVFKSKNNFTDNLLNFLNSSGLDFSVHFNLAHDQVIDLMKAADIGIILARPFEDASGRTGIKSIEYISNSLILLASSCLSDVKKIIEDYEIGIVIEDVVLKDIDIQNIINIYMQNHISYKSNVTKLYKEHFSSDLILNQYNKILCNL
jgi:hypothetical protein